MTAADAGVSGRRLPSFSWPAAAILVVLIMLVYSPAFHAGFIWDDDVHLTENPCITGSLGFGEIWTSSRAIYYPLIVTTFWILHKFVGLNPFPYHLFTILVHAGTAILLWRVLTELGVRGAWLGAALWAVHPVTVESVAWITELKNTQSGLFYLLSIFFFLRWNLGQQPPKTHPWYFALSLVFYALAITSKPSTVMLPVVLGLCLWWRRKLQPVDFVGLGPFVVISAAASAWTVWEQEFHAHAHGVEWAETWLERLAIAGRDLWFYLGKLIWPEPLIFIYPRWQIDVHGFLTFIPLLAAIAGLIFLWWKRQTRWRPVFFALAYFTVSLFPVLGFFNVYFFRYSFVSDHFQYLGSMGPLALAGAGLASLFERSKQAPSWLEPVFSGMLLLALALLSWRQVHTFNDLETLWRTTLKKNPGCWLAHTDLGVLLNSQGKTDEAETEYRAALKLKPDFPEALTSLGALQARKGETDEALANFQAALRAQPNFAPAWYDLGNLLAAKGKLDDAIAAYQSALHEWPLYFEARNALAVALSRAGRLEEAIPNYLQALQIKPDDAGVHNNVGFTLAQMGNLDEAIRQLQEAIRLSPASAQFYVNLGQVLSQMGHRDEAIKNFNKALRIQPDHAEAKYRLKELGVTASQ